MVAGLKPGVAAALEALAEAHTLADGDGAGDPPPAARQLGMFGVAGETRIAAEDGPKGPGRPDGARNKRSEALGRYLASLGHKHPAVTLSELQSKTAVELAKALGCTRLEAQAIIVAAADKLMPYVAQKLPTAPEPGDDGGERPMLLIGSMKTARPGGTAGALGLDDPVEEMADIGHSDEADSEDVAR